MSRLSKITISHDVPAEKTLVFEQVYEEDLRSELKDKREMLDKGNTTWLFVDDELAGEAQSIGVKELCEIEDDKMEDIDDRRYLTERTSYLYSFTILPKFQKQGYGRILFSAHLSHLIKKNYGLFTCHCTSPEMVSLCKSFGAYFMQDGIHRNWYGTKRTAYFCELRIGGPSSFVVNKQPDDYSCGAYAVKTLLEMFLGRYYPADYLRRELGTNADTGTGCEKVIQFFKKNKVPIRAGAYRTLWGNLPMLVRYVDLDEPVEHYAIVLSKSTHEIQVFDPWIGGVMAMKIAKFYANWHSKRYGKNWGLSLL